MNATVRSPLRQLSSRETELGNRIFCLSVVLLLVLSEVFSSSIQSTLPGFSHLCRIVLTLGSAVLLVFKCVFLTGWQSRRQAAVAAAAMLYSAFAAFYGNDQWFFLAVLVGIAAKDVDLRRALKVYLATAVAGVVGVQLLQIGKMHWFSSFQNRNRLPLQTGMCCWL